MNEWPDHLVESLPEDERLESQIPLSPSPAQDNDGFFPNDDSLDGSCPEHYPGRYKPDDDAGGYFIPSTRFTSVYQEPDQFSIIDPAREGERRANGIDLSRGCVCRNRAAFLIIVTAAVILLSAAITSGILVAKANQADPEVPVNLPFYDHYWVSLKFEDWQYLEEYSNPDTLQYQSAASKACKLITEIFSNNTVVTENLKVCKVHKFRLGSVTVDYMLSFDIMEERLAAEYFVTEITSVISTANLTTTVENPEALYIVRSQALPSEQYNPLKMLQIFRVFSGEVTVRANSSEEIRNSFCKSMLPCISTDDPLRTSCYVTEIRPSMEYADIIAENASISLDGPSSTNPNSTVYSQNFLVTYFFQLPFGCSEATDNKTEVTRHTRVFYKQVQSALHGECSPTVHVEKRNSSFPMSLLKIVLLTDLQYSDLYDEFSACREQGVYPEETASILDRSCHCRQSLFPSLFSSTSNSSVHNFTSSSSLHTTPIPLASEDLTLETIAPFSGLSTTSLSFSTLSLNEDNSERTAEPHPVPKRFGLGSSFSPSSLSSSTTSVSGMPDIPVSSGSSTSSTASPSSQSHESQTTPSS